MEILVMFIIIVITSAAILLLVQSGIISVRAESEQVSLLNVEFIPFNRGGYLTIKEFSFCKSVNEQYQCIAPKDIFALGDEIHFLLAAESSTYDGRIVLVENYRIKGPGGELLLDVDEKRNFEFDVRSVHDRELVVVKDYFVISRELAEGTYTLELLLTNPLLDKKVMFVKTFEMKKRE